MFTVVVVMVIARVVQQDWVGRHVTGPLRTIPNLRFSLSARNMVSPILAQDLPRANCRYNLRPWSKVVVPEKYKQYLTFVEQHWGNGQRTRRSETRRTRGTSRAVEIDSVEVRQGACHFTVSCCSADIQAIRQCR